MIPVSQGKPYAGNPHVRFEEGASAQAAPRRSALLHTRNRQSVRKTGGMRGDPSAEALSYKQVSRSASEPLLLSPVNSNIPCGQRVSAREAEKKRRSRFAAWKAWRGIEGRHVWNVTPGTWEVCGAKALQKSDEVIVALKRCNDRGAKGLYLQNETIRIASREESNGRKTHQRGQSALGRRVGNRSAVARSVRWNQCETRPKGIGERDQ